MTDTVDWDDDILGDDIVEDGLIELTDVVKEDLDVSEDETIIDLSDIVEDEPNVPENFGLEMDEPEDDFFAEEETLSDNGFGLETEGLEIEEPLIEEELVEEDESLEEELLEEELLEEELLEEELLEEEAVLPVVPVSSAVEDSVNMEQLEEALERVIEKKFAGKIETILFEVLERVIEKEIAQIKESLQKDLDQIGNG